MEAPSRSVRPGSGKTIPARQRRFHRRPAVPAACLLFTYIFFARQQPHRNRRLQSYSSTQLAASGIRRARVARARAWVRAAAKHQHHPLASRARLDGRRRAFPHALDLRGDWLASACALPVLLPLVFSTAPPARA
jgi:hypothetical protein